MSTAIREPKNRANTDNENNENNENKSKKLILIVRKNENRHRTDNK